MNLYQRCKIFQPWVESVQWMKVRLTTFEKNTAVVLCSVWFRCSGVFLLAFSWFSVGILGCSACVPGCSVVSPLFQDVSLFCSSLVFLGVPCSIVPCSGVPGYIVCRFCLLYLNVHDKKNCLQFFCDGKLITSLSHFWISLTKTWYENSISILIHPEINHFWTWLFGRAANERGKGPRRRWGHRWTTCVW